MNRVPVHTAQVTEDDLVRHARARGGIVVHHRGRTLWAELLGWTRTTATDKPGRHRRPGTAFVRFPNGATARIPYADLVALCK